MDEWFINTYKAYYDELHRFIYALSGDGSIVEDIIQDTFMALYNKQRELKTHPYIRGWLYTTARNKVWDYNKKKNKKKKYEIELSTQALEKTYHIDTIPNNIYDILSDFLTDEEIKLLKINQEYGFKIKEIAEFKGVKADTMGKKIYRIKLKARKILEKILSITIVLIFWR